MFKKSTPFHFSAVAGAVLAACTGQSAYAQTTAVDEKQIEKVEVTATRRSGTLQEVPINISALTSDVLQQQNIEDLDAVARWVPGLTVTDQGGTVLTCSTSTMLFTELVPDVAIRAR